MRLTTVFLGVMGSTILWFSVAACRKLPPAVPRIERVIRMQDAGIADSGVAAVAQEYKEMEALLTELLKFREPQGTYGLLSSQKTPASFRAFPALKAFPKSSAARAVMVTYGDFELQPACTDMPFAKDGTLCGSVYVPDKELSPSELSEVLGVIPVDPPPNTPGHLTGPASFACGFDAHHAVVFYDDKGTPIGKVLVCFTCGEWLVTPGSHLSGSNRPAVMGDKAGTALRRIAAAHGLAPWRFGDTDEALRTRLDAYVLARYGTEESPTAARLARRSQRLAPGSGVSKGKKLRDLTPEERFKLCQWTSHEAKTVPGRFDPMSFGSRYDDLRTEPRRVTDMSPGLHENDDGSGWHCPDGTEWSHHTSNRRCMERALPCDQSIERLEACLEKFREPRDLCAAELPECEGLRECIPLLERRTPKL
jgi:hypothetical protein